MRADSGPAENLNNANDRRALLAGRSTVLVVVFTLLTSLLVIGGASAQEGPPYRPENLWERLPASHNLEHRSGILAQTEANQRGLSWHLGVFGGAGAGVGFLTGIIRDSRCAHDDWLCGGYVLVHAFYGLFLGSFVGGLVWASE